VEEVAKEARMEKSNIAFDYAHQERLYREIFRRMVNPDYVNAEAAYPGKDKAKDFVKRCEDRGVPRKVLLKVDNWDVYAVRAIGMGSWGVKMDITNQVLNARALYDEAGQQAATRDWLAARVGYQNVDRYKAFVNRDKMPTNERSIAALENNDFAEGWEVPAGSDQTHAIHLNTHMEPVMAVVQAVQQMRDPAELDLKRAMNILGRALPHIQAHLQYLAADPARKAMVDQYVEVLRVAMETHKKLQQAAQKIQEAQLKAQEEQAKIVQEAQGVLQDRDAQLKALEIQKKYEAEMAKQQSLNAARQQKTTEQMGIRRQQAQADVQLRAERQSAELQMDAAKAQAEIAIKQAKAGAGGGGSGE
jgi:hypothetical protein